MFRAYQINMMATLIARSMGPKWVPSGTDRTQVGPMLAPWTLLSGYCFSGDAMTQDTRSHTVYCVNDLGTCLTQLKISIISAISIMQIDRIFFSLFLLKFGASIFITCRLQKRRVRIDHVQIKIYVKYARVQNLSIFVPATMISCLSSLICFQIYGYILLSKIVKYYFNQTG